MKLRLLFTLAILVGLAAAPGAQTFRWKAGNSQVDERIRVHVDERIAHTVDRAGQRHPAMYDGGRGRQAGGNRSDGCDASRDRDNDNEQVCEEREESMPSGPLTVDAAPNGGITVEAWDKNEIHLRAIVRANARSEGRAKELASGVQVRTGSGHVSATGPDMSEREWWSVSYHVNVPRRNDLELKSQNGGISITGVTGQVSFDTTNGGVRLVDLGGDVRGRTRNGGLTVMLNGREWDGAGLDVETTNGGVTLSIPDGYNARLEARTQNGGLRSDYPMTVTGELSSRRGVSAQLGSGGAPVRVRTTNGGLKIGRR